MWHILQSRSTASLHYGVWPANIDEAIVRVKRRSSQAWLNRSNVLIREYGKLVLHGVEFMENRDIKYGFGGRLTKKTLRSQCTTNTHEYGKIFLGFLFEMIFVCI